jgi:predicted alpha/beta superfamily hydrolase
MRTTSLRALLAALAGALILVGCVGGGSSGSAAVTLQQVNGHVVLASIDSQRTGYTYPVMIHVPLSYDSSNEPYATIYVLDGDANFSGTGTRFDNLRAIVSARGAKAIVVGIGGTVRRQTDFNFPGATAYHDFVTLELMPYIEARYRTDVHKRILSGLSTGGTFAATALFIEAPKQMFFTHFISDEGAFWQQPDIVASLEQKMFDATHGQVSATLILARSSLVNTNGPVVDTLYQQMAARGYQGLQLIETSFPYNHVGTDNPSFDDAIARILG